MTTSRLQPPNEQRSTFPETVSNLPPSSGSTISNLPASSDSTASNLPASSRSIVDQDSEQFNDPDYDVNQVSESDLDELSEEDDDSSMPLARNARSEPNPDRRLTNRAPFSRPTRNRSKEVAFKTKCTFSGFQPYWIERPPTGALVQHITSVTRDHFYSQSSHPTLADKCIMADMVAATNSCLINQPSQEDPSGIVSIDNYQLNLMIKSDLL